MTRAEQLRCVVSFRGVWGQTECREVLLSDVPPDSQWAHVAREALWQQHDIVGASIASIRVCSDQDADFLIADPEAYEAGIARVSPQSSHSLPVKTLTNRRMAS